MSCEWHARYVDRNFGLHYDWLGSRARSRSHFLLADQCFLSCCIYYTHLTGLFACIMFMCRVRWSIRSRLGFVCAPPRPLAVIRPACPGSGATRRSLQGPMPVNPPPPPPPPPAVSGQCAGCITAHPLDPSPNTLSSMSPIANTPAKVEFFTH